MNFFFSNSNARRTGTAPKLAQALMITGALALSACGGGESGSSIAMYASAKSGLVVRSGPGVANKKLGLIPYRGEVAVLEQSESTETIAGKTGRWARIEYAKAGDGQAWVFGGFLPASEPEDAPEAPKVVSLQAGDIACYVELDYGNRTDSLLADFEICEQPLVGKRISFETRKENVMAASCEGDPECGDSEQVDLITSVKVQ